MSWVVPTTPAVGSQATAGWADQVTGDLALVASPAFFFGSLDTSSVSVPSGANVPFNTLGVIVEDTIGGWDNTNHWWKCAAPGLYLITCAMKATTGTALAPLILKNGNPFFTGSLGGVSAPSGNALTGVGRLALNDTISFRTSATYTSFFGLASDLHNNYLEILQVSWV